MAAAAEAGSLATLTRPPGLRSPKRLRFFAGVEAVEATATGATADTGSLEWLGLPWRSDLFVSLRNFFPLNEIRIVRIGAQIGAAAVNARARRVWRSGARVLASRPVVAPSPVPAQVPCSPLRGEGQITVTGRRCSASLAFAATCRQQVNSPGGSGCTRPSARGLRAREQTFRLRPHPKVPLMLAGRMHVSGLPLHLMFHSAVRTAQKWKPGDPAVEHQIRLTLKSPNGTSGFGNQSSY